MSVNQNREEPLGLAFSFRHINRHIIGRILNVDNP
jgi:hypothetical protein